MRFSRRTTDWHIGNGKGTHRRLLNWRLLTWVFLPLLFSDVTMAQRPPGKGMPAIPKAPPGTGVQTLKGTAAASNPNNPDTTTGGGTQGCDKPHTTDPISIIRGGVLRHEEDIRIPCPLIDLEFSRSYSSTLMYTGPWGANWTHSYDWRLYEVTVTNTPVCRSDDCSCAPI